MRAKSMFIIYALGFIAVVTIGIADLTSDLPNKVGLMMVYGGLLTCLATGLVLEPAMVQREVTAAVMVLLVGLMEERRGTPAQATAST